MNTILKVTDTLADPVRYSIYEYILKTPSEVTVQDVASEFNIHSNVARLYLAKLEDVNLIDFFYTKQEKASSPKKYIKLLKKRTVCRIHKAFLQGVLESLLGETFLSQKATMVNGCSDRKYHAIVKN